MRKNPFLQKKSKKHSLLNNSPIFNKNQNSLSTCHSKEEKKTKEAQTLKDSGLLTLNSKEKNPIIFPSSLKKYMTKRKMTLSPGDISKLNSFAKKNVVSFDDRLNSSRKKSLNTNKTSIAEIKDRGSLRWDDFTFTNKKQISKEELKNIKKHFKDKGLLKSIELYQNSKIYGVEAKTKKIKKEGKQALSVNSDTCREDVFGNKIIKGGRNHRVSFSYKGDMKVVENWKKFNLKNTIPPDHSKKFLEDDENKKKCRVF
jgi:hypothetical protein